MSNAFKNRYIQQPLEANVITEISKLDVMDRPMENPFDIQKFFPSKKFISLCKRHTSILAGVL